MRNLLATGGVALILSRLAGVLLVISEYRYGTIHPTFLFTPRRSRVLSAKLAASLLAGLVFGLAGVGLALGLGSLILSARGIPSVLDRGDIGLLLLGGSAGWRASRCGARSASGSAPSSATRVGRRDRPDGLGLRGHRPCSG